MPAISRVVVRFTGSAVVGPSTCSHYTTGQTTSFQVAVKDLWALMGDFMPSTCTITVPNTGETFDDATGELTDLWTAGTVGQDVGATTGPYAAGVGGRVVWTTNGLTNNRRVQGSTFLVPMVAAQYGTDGTIDNAAVTALQNAANQFVNATIGDSTIWTRPVNGSGGKTNGITGAFFRDKVATLRSRRT